MRKAKRRKKGKRIREIRKRITETEERNNSNEFEIPKESFQKQKEDNWNRNAYYNILRAISAMQHSSSTPHQERKEEHNPMTNLG